MRDFDRAVLQMLERLFTDGEIETRTYRSDLGDDFTEHGVMVIHGATGTAVVSDEFQSKVRNKSVAMIELLKILQTREGRF